MSRDRMSFSEQPSLDIDAVVGESESRSETLEIRSSRSKKRSFVWDHFGEIVGEKVVRCKHCDSPLSKGKNSGTSHMKRHLTLSCKKIPEEEREKIIAATVDDLFDAANFKFDPMLTRGLMTLLCIDAEIPFAAIENRFWEPTMRSLRPEYKSVGRHTMREDCVGVFKAGRDAILAEFEELDSRVSFTSDLWTSSATLGYMCVTAHWIDKEFRFHKKIIALKQIPYPHTSGAVALLIEKIWKEWKLDHKIFVITLDNATVNDSAVRILEHKLGNNMLFDGSHMHIRCSAHILNLIVKNGIGLIDTALEHIRELLKHIASSGSRLQGLNTILDELKLPRKRGLTLDCPTRWNSSFEMVKEALRLQEALVRYLENSSLAGPTADEWTEAEAMAQFLEPFLDATKNFSNVRRPSSHTYIKEVWNIRRLLVDEDHKDNAKLEELALEMQPKFCKYWEDPNLILTIATFFDPRYKFIFVKFCYRKAYKDDHEARIDYVLVWLKMFYERYESSMRNTNRASSGSSSHVGSSSRSGKRKLDEEFAQFTSENYDSHSSMSELDKYMQEPLLDMNVKNFDILEFWKQNSGLYPTLAKMARDFLAVQTSSVASESAFSAAGRLTDNLRSSMNSETLEALICAKDWLGQKDEEFDLSKYLHLIQRS